MLYDIVGERFSRVRSARFRPPLRFGGVTPEARFHAYIAAFNRGDYAALRRHYAEDVQLVIGNGIVLTGRDAIVDFYRPVKAATDRTIVVLQCFHDGDVLAAELESTFTALEDLPDFPSGPMRRGDRRYINSLVLYDCAGSRYTRIRAAVLKRRFLPAANVHATHSPALTQPPPST